MKLLQCTVSTGLEIRCKSAQPKGYQFFRARNKIKKGHSQNEQNGYGSMLFHRTFLRGTIAIGKGTIAIGCRCRRLFRALVFANSEGHHSD